MQFPLNSVTYTIQLQFQIHMNTYYPKYPCLSQQGLFVSVSWVKLWVKVLKAFVNLHHIRLSYKGVQGHEMLYYNAFRHTVKSREITKSIPTQF